MIVPILRILLPVARKLGKAMRKDSPGGKKITKKEVLDIFLGEADDVAERLEKL